MDGIIFCLWYYLMGWRENVENIRHNLKESITDEKV